MVVPRPPAEVRALCLVCDDDPDVRNVLEKLLVHYKCEVVTVARGDEVLPQLRRRQFDLLLLDQQLGSEDGLDVLRAIRRDEPQVADTPVCMLSGGMLQRDEMLAAGADEFLRKPPRLEELFKVVDQQLALGRERRTKVDDEPSLFDRDV